MTRLARFGLVLALLGCEEEVAPVEEAQFECESMDGVTFCDDFNAGDDAAWIPEGGTWSVVDGRYVGSGPMMVDTECGASLMTASIRDSSETADLSMHVELSSEARLDKTIVLRATDPANRIELNFRGAPIDDLIVQELVDCEVVFHTGEGEVRVPQPEGETVEVDIELRGNRLLVMANGEAVISRDFDFANTDPGSIGLAVIDNAITRFDSVWMTRL